MQEPPPEVTPAETARRTSRTSPGAIVVVVAGVVAFVGLFLPWFKTSESAALLQSGLNLPPSGNGIDTSDGKIFIVLAIALVVVGVVALVTGVGRWIGIVAIVLGVLTAAFAIYEITALKDSVADSILDALKKQAPTEPTQDQLDQARGVILQFIDRGAISVKAGVGLFLGAAGGVAAALGGIMLLGERRGATIPAEEAAPGGGMAVGPAMGGFQGESPSATTPADPAPSTEPVSPAPPAPPASEPVPPGDPSYPTEPKPPPPPTEPPGDQRPGS